jgi:hypothetical protein
LRTDTDCEPRVDLKPAARLPEADVLTDCERELLERLATEGKASRLLDEEMCVGKALERSGLLFLVGARAVVTPKARKLLAMLREAPNGKVIRGF